jgi:hypothetical protein
MLGTIAAGSAAIGFRSFIRFNSAKAPWYSVKSILAKTDVPTVSKALEFALRMAN